MRRIESLVTVLAACIAVSACVPTEVGSGRRIKTEEASGLDGSVSDRGFIIDDAGVMRPPPPDAGVTIAPFDFASMGTRCSDGELETYLVLSSRGQKCEENAQALSNGAPTYPLAVFELSNPTAPSSFDASGTVCLEPGACETRSIHVELESLVPGSSATGRWSIQLDGMRAEGSLSANWCNFDLHLGGGGPIAAPNLALTEVALYQSVKVSIAQNGSPVTDRNAPVVQARPGLIRLFVEPQTGWSPHEVIGRLELHPGGGVPPTVLESRLTVRGGSAEDDLNTTLNFDVPPDLMTSALEIAAGVFETQGCSEERGNTSALFPAQGTAPLSPESAGGAFHVVLVPVQYDADGSGRLPDISPDQLSIYHEVMYGMFPVPELNITVREPFPWNASIRAGGTGWGSILDAILDLRNEDNAPANVYYYGIFTPSATFGGFCGGGCIVGLGPVPSASDDYSRGSVGVGYPGRGSAETFAHEIGHALGRGHAPCGVSGSAGYPYSGARLGVWGFDLLNHELKHPSDFRDVMSYCDPVWISDYHFSKFFDRIQYVNAQAPFAPTGAATTWRNIVIEPEGMAWGRRIELRSPPQGEPREVHFVGSAGGPPDVVTGYLYPYSHMEGGLLMVPDPGPQVAEVVIPGVGSIVR